MTIEIKDHLTYRDGEHLVADQLAVQSENVLEPLFDLRNLIY